MATKNVQLPELGEGVTEGELVKWLVKVGDKISPDQPVAEMMTDKATVEVPSPIAGIVKEIQKKEGDVIEVGAVMLVVETDGAATVSAPTATKPAASQPAAAATQPAAMMASAPAAKTAAVQTSGGADVYPPVTDARVLATPATRRLA
ncbi:MAG: biotin/lipoyl-containing protein, partial [Bdellovibrionales bacterium]|nr:biotin/lipoyl-containing protein [Bdellovibrionales bacterium]